jgi:hypothetical protein
MATSIEKAFGALMASASRGKVQAKSKSFKKMVQTFDEKWPGGRAAAAQMFDILVYQQEIERSKAKKVIATAMRKALAKGKKGAFDGVGQLNTLVYAELNKGKKKAKT